MCSRVHNIPVCIYFPKYNCMYIWFLQGQIPNCYYIMRLLRNEKCITQRVLGKTENYKEEITKRETANLLDWEICSSNPPCESSSI